MNSIQKHISITGALLAALFITSSLSADTFTEEEIATSATLADVDTQPEPVKQVQPEIPSDLKGASGYVRVAFLIDTDGNVMSPRIQKSSSESFESLAIDAINKWKFKPAKKGGSPVAVRVILPFRFTN